MKCRLVIWINTTESSASMSIRCLAILSGLLFAALGTASAQNEGRSLSQKEISIPLKAERSVNVPIRLSDIMEAPQYIRITSKGLVGKIGDVKFQDGRFYVLDMDHSSLLVLDGEGRERFTIRKQGRAWDEYISLWSFDVHPRTGEISIYDQAGRKIVVFSPEGKYLRTVSVPVDGYGVFRDLAVTMQGSYLLYAPDPHGKRKFGLFEMDASGKMRRQLVCPERDFRQCVLRQPLTYFSRLSDGSLRLMGEADRDEDYTFSAKGELFVPYRFVYDVRLSAKTRRSEYPATGADETYHQVTNSIETDRWILFLLFFRNRSHYMVYHKPTGRLQMAVPDARGRFGRDLVLDGRPFLPIRGAGDRVLSYVEYDPDNVLFQQAVQAVGPTENPVLVVAKLK